MTDVPNTLQRLGDALESAASANLSSSSARVRRMRLAIAAVVVAVLIPGVALAASQLIGTDEVAQSLPAGTLALAGTNPTCTVVVQNVEYLCRLERAPAPEVSDWKGTVEPTVDATKHVNGGCRSLTSDGRTWRCYLGRAAIDQQIIGEGFLGEYAPAPGVGWRRRSPAVSNARLRVRLSGNDRGGDLRFLFLIHGDSQAEAAMSPDERRAIVGEHIAYAGMLRERGAHVLGEALSGDAVVVRPGETPIVTDGPFADTKEGVGGFYVVECANRDEAIELAGRVPQSPGVAVEVLEIADV